MDRMLCVLMNMRKYRKTAFFLLIVNWHPTQTCCIILLNLGMRWSFYRFWVFFVLYAPKMWEALLSGSLVSLVFCSLLKNIFAVPRPAAIFDNEGFTIIGRRLSGCTSLPSGHSITVFTVLTVLMFALMPKRLWYKMGWIFS